MNPALRIATENFDDLPPSAQRVLVDGMGGIDRARSIWARTVGLEFARARAERREPNLANAVARIDSASYGGVPS